MLDERMDRESVPKLTREGVYPYLMETFLRSRTESGHPSNADYYDEDVNVYIVNLLCLLIDPVYHLQTKDYVADYSTDVFDKVRYSKDNRFRYWVYKTNADRLLVWLGIFRRGEPRHGGGALPEDLERTAGRGKIYYSFAKNYCEVLGRRSKALAEVLGKLSYGFEKYVEILDHMRGEYLNLIDKLSEGEMYHLLREIDRIGEQERAKRKYDELLDLYLEWKRTGDDKLLRRIREVAAEIGALDPSFKFEVPRGAERN